MMNIRKTFISWSWAQILAVKLFWIDSLCGLTCEKAFFIQIMHRQNWIIWHLIGCIWKIIGLKLMNALLLKIFIRYACVWCITTLLILKGLLFKLVRTWVLIDSSLLTAHNDLTNLGIIISILINLSWLFLYNILKYPKVLINLIKIINLNFKSVRFNILFTLIFTGRNFLIGKIPLK